MNNEILAEGGGEKMKRVSGMYKDWFLDYASYVILERAIPSIMDGLKPVQRRILHSMKEMEDGRYNKVANLVGNTMKYHPHGDAAITDAMVQLGQKDLLIDAQGNWGNIYTGDRAAAARYIEARLTPFALEVAFNGKTTKWVSSYDGRNDEPIDLPMKFPLLLAQGVEGIAVGLSTKILPHNFIELIDASVLHLKGKPFQLLPDFITGGMVEVSDYNHGKRGGKIRVRARIEIADKSTLVIKEIPFGTTTTSLMESIVKASQKGKIKIKKIEDNTASEVLINVHLAAGTSPDKTLDALYAFTDCEVSISPNACLISNDKPCFIGVEEILISNTEQTKYLLKRELEIALDELNEKWHFTNLERIFIEHKIYRKIETEESWEGVLSAIDIGLQPFTGELKRAVTQDDILRLTEIKIKRISKFDLNKASDLLLELDKKIEEVKYNIEYIVAFAIDYYQNLKKKYGKGRERKTEIKVFDQIDAAKVAAANVKFYANFKEGFVGTSLKKDDFMFECSDLDDIIVISQSGKLIITKVDQKTYIDKNILHVAVWKKKDKRTVYNLIYKDGETNYAYMKRFSVTSITRDKLYDLGSEHPKTEILYFSANPNGEAEVVEVQLRNLARLKKLRFDIDFAALDIKSRTTKGNLVTKYSIKKIALKNEGLSTLAPRKIWFDEVVNRLNVDGQGLFLGSFRPEEKILCINKKGEALLKSFDLSNHFEEELLVLQKWNPTKPIVCIYLDGEKNRYYIKRFLLDDTTSTQAFFAAEDEQSHIEYVITEENVKAEIAYLEGKSKIVKTDTIDLDLFIEIKGIKAKGNQLINKEIAKVELTYPEIVETEETVEETEEPTEQKNQSQNQSKTSEKDSDNDSGVQGRIDFDA